MIEEALTFDDVLLQPAESSIGPGDANVKTQLTNKIHLNIPLISSAMDTVTEHKLAIAIAQLGGIGVIHKNFSIERQAKEVEKVKKYESGMVINPITISPESKIEDAFALMDKYKIFTVAIDYANVKGCRISPNIFTTTDELDRFVDAVKKMAT